MNAISPTQARQTEERLTAEEQQTCRMNSEVKPAPIQSAPVAPKLTAGQQRRKRLVSLAGTMHKCGMTEGAIAAVLLAENKNFAPPLPEDRVQAIAHDIPARYPNTKPESSATQPAVTSTPKPVIPALSPENATIRTTELLATCETWIRRYVVVTDEQAVIMAAWLLHTYTIDACELTPYLHVTGPEKAVGKTLLMDVLAALACNPSVAAGASPAALLRVVDKSSPTMFLDEMDAATHGSKEVAEVQRGILNAGFRRGGVFRKCDGPNNDVRAFNAFSPKCFAGIGALPDTIASRSIPIEMRRKLRSERIEHYRSRVVAQLAAPMRSELEKWAGGVIAQLKTIEPQPIDALTDRQNDIAEPLLAIAQLARADWLQRLTSALLTVYGSAVADDASLGIVLLSDIRNIFEEQTAVHIPSKKLATALNEIEGRPWADLDHGHGLTANHLARLLSEYRVQPRTIRIGAETVKGYRRTDFEDAFARYCPSPDSQPVTTSHPASLLAKTTFPKRNAENPVTDGKLAQPSMDTGVLRYDVSKPDILTQEDIFS